MDSGILTISLDFELYWGVRDNKSIEQYRENLLGARKAIPEMLRIFAENNIHATWATVGFLFFDDHASLKNSLPSRRPTYHEQNLSPYPYINGGSALESVYHFAPDLIRTIAACAGQEICTHTLSHYYCLEKGQTIEQFEEDIRLAVATAKSHGISISSIVFPRNQWSKEYLALLENFGIKCFRGNERSWIYRAAPDCRETKAQRGLRLLDAYVNLSGHNTYELENCLKETPFNFPASRFLRPYSARLSTLEWLRLRRITNAMSDAAINGKIFHLWWHPHNFGANTEKNMEFLGKILEHFQLMKTRHGMKSMNMGEISLLGETIDGEQKNPSGHAMRKRSLVQNNLQ